MWRRMAVWLRALLLRGRAEAELDEELRYHLDRETERNLARGLGPEEARRAAERAFGNVAWLKDGMRDAWGLGWWEALVQDARFALRGLRRTPGLALAALAVLALGIGANASVFAALEATLLAPPPYRDADRLVLLDLTESSRVRPAPPRSIPWSYSDYEILAAGRALPLVGSAAYGERSVTLFGVGEAAYLPVELVTPGYLRVLGVAPALGRGFAPADDAEGAAPVAILEHSLWRERFGADPAVAGRVVTVDGRPVTVVGVAPPGFRGLGGRARLFLPVRAGAALIAPALTRLGGIHWLRVVGRLAPGASLASAGAPMAALGRAIDEAAPAGDPTLVQGAAAESYVAARVNPKARRTVLVLSAAAALLLLAACANLAALLLARASGRARESAVRVALGAGRWRVARGFLLEALALSLAGAGAALLLARWGARALAAAWPARFLNGSWSVRGLDLGAVSVDGRVVAFALFVALLTALLLGALPALAASQVSPAIQLRAGAGGEWRGRRGVDLRGGLVAVEVALALVLLVGAGLLLRSLRQLQSVDRGYRSGNLVTFAFDIPGTSRWAGDVAGFNERYLEWLRALPDIRSAAVTCVAPLGGHCVITGVRRAGGRTWDEGSRPRIGVNYVSDEFFRTLGVPLRRGRTFGPRDRKGSPPVVVLSETAARELFPEGHALGSPVALGLDLTPADRGATAEVIGVVGDVLYDRPENGVMADAYVEQRQEPGAGRIVARTRGEPLSAILSARAALAAIDPGIPIHDVTTDAQWEATATADTRVLGALLAAFAALALLMACMGVWAVVSYAVTRRTPELGLRIALGAEPGQVVALVVRGGLIPAALGALAGGAAAWGGARALRSFLYDVAPTDPGTFALAAAVLLGVAALAAWLPARRATRVDPMEALRAE